MNNVVTTQDVDCISRMSKAFAEGGLFGFLNAGQAFTLMMVAQANGLHPAKALERYHIINNKPTMKADAMLAAFQEAGGSVKWITRTDEECKLHLSHPQGGELDVTWNMKRAQKAGLGLKDNWKKFPTQMLAARCVSEGVRALYPACLNGMYTPEEVSDFKEDTDKETITKETPTKNIIKKKEVKEAEIVPNNYDTNKTPLFSTSEPQKEEPKQETAENKKDTPEPLNDKKRADFQTLVANAVKELGQQTVNTILNNFGGLETILDDRTKAAEVALILKQTPKEV